jgi:hypothetical protein
MRCGLQFSHDEDRVDSRDGSAYVLELTKYDSEIKRPSSLRARMKTKSNNRHVTVVDSHGYPLFNLAGMDLRQP